MASSETGPGSDISLQTPEEAERAFEEARTILEQMANIQNWVGTTPHRLSRAWGKETWSAELRYRALVEKIPAVTFVAGLDDTVPELYVSPQIEALLGFSQEEWIENPFLWYQQLHPDDRHRWAVEFANTCGTGAPFRSDYRLLARDGRVVWVHGECQIIQDDEGRPRFLQGIAFDITSSKHAEEILRRSHEDLEERVRLRTAELAESEGRLRAIVETAVDGIITIDEEGRLMSFNPAAARIFGYASDEVVGWTFDLLIASPDNHESGNEVQVNPVGWIRRIVGTNREFIGRRKDGTSFPMELAVSETVVGDRPLFTGIIRDVTSSKRDRLELQAAKEAAEEASRAKDHFLAVLSHELRTPLTPVLGAVQMMEADAAVPLEVKETVSMIRRNIELEARIIDDLLDLTRISRGKVELRMELVDAHASLRHSLGVWQQQIDEKGLQVTLHLSAKRHYVRADPARLQQVYWNLIGNAVKFTPEGGQIILRSMDDRDGRLVVQIADSGIGIDKEMLPRLFSAFEQGERTVTRRYGGLGLGLSISKALIEMHRGTLIASSEGVGRGARFTLSLTSVAAPPLAQPAIAQGGDSTCDKSRILLVEDHEDTRRIMCRLLRSWGHTVTAASSVSSALEFAESQQFDLLISDLGLPDGSGTDLIRQLLPRQAIKAIALSGYGMEEDMAQTRAAGFLAHLTKPVDLQKLQEVVRQILLRPVA